MHAILCAMILFAGVAESAAAIAIGLVVATIADIATDEDDGD